MQHIPKELDHMLLDTLILGCGIAGATLTAWIVVEGGAWVIGWIMRATQRQALHHVTRECGTPIPDDAGAHCRGLAARPKRRAIV